MMNEEFRDKLIYIAGFFDGEGCVSGHLSKGENPGVRINIGQRRPEILYWIKEVLEMREVYFSSNGYKRWRIGNKEDIEKFINLILPYSIVKKEELIVGQKLNNLVGKVGYHTHITPENLRERMILFNQLKLLKKKGQIYGSGKISSG